MGHGLGVNCGATKPTEFALPQPLEINRASSWTQCTAGEIFSTSACACLPYTLCRRDAPCPTETPFNNPLKGFGCECISRDDYNLIYNHGLGRDCKEDSQQSSIYPPYRPLYTYSP